MEVGWELYVDVGLILFIAFVFFVMAMQMARRSRRPDALSWSLIALFTSLALGYAMAGFGAIHIVPPMLPIWLRWALRISVAVSGALVVILLAREEIDD